MKACPVCNKPFRYSRYYVQLLDDPLPQVRFLDTHLLCKKKVREFEQTKINMKYFFESQGVHILDLY